MNWNPKANFERFFFRRHIIYAMLGLLYVNFFILSCGYSHSGSSLNYDIYKTVQIANFPNNSPLVNPNLSQDFTLALQDRFIQRTNMQMIESVADINIEGEITGYTFSPVGVVSGSSGNDTASQNRLSISVMVHYDNKKEPEKSFDKTFTDYADISSNIPIETAQITLIDEIIKRLIDQMYNAIVADW